MSEDLPSRIRVFEEPLREAGYNLHSIIETGRILDAGCGFGGLVAELQRHNSDAYGIDIDPKVINGTERIIGAKQRALYPEKMQVADVIKIPFPDDHFDTAVSIGLFNSLGGDLEYIQAMSQARENPYELPEKAMREIYRVVKRGGLYLVFPNRSPGLPIDNFQKLYPKGRRYDTVLILGK